MTLPGTTAVSIDPPVPKEWDDRFEQGKLVYSTDARASPQPYFGNGYVSTQSGASGLFVAGIFTGPSYTSA